MRYLSVLFFAKGFEFDAKMHGSSEFFLNNPNSPVNNQNSIVNNLNSSVNNGSGRQRDPRLNFVIKLRELIVLAACMRRFNLITYRYVSLSITYFVFLVKSLESRGSPKLTEPRLRKFCFNRQNYKVLRIY